MPGGGSAAPVAAAQIATGSVLPPRLPPPSPSRRRDLPRARVPSRVVLAFVPGIALQVPAAAAAAGPGSGAAAALSGQPGPSPAQLDSVLRSSCKPGSCYTPDRPPSTRLLPTARPLPDSQAHMQVLRDLRCRCRRHRHRHPPHPADGLQPSAVWTRPGGV
ncbi:CAAX box protein 1-like [Phocoena sinus]|uniref:CAAX box protein 1-like n=1 Tax=Phocoena sinus TaxID=42100 RepID=UPI0013C4ADC6|nr:CAAX box protein 1-like [Phocoena sinus]